jgi:hypothetical protein
MLFFCFFISSSAAMGLGVVKLDDDQTASESIPSPTASFSPIPSPTPSSSPISSPVRTPWATPVPTASPNDPGAAGVSGAARSSEAPSQLLPGVVAGGVVAGVVVLALVVVLVVFLWKKFHRKTKDENSVAVPINVNAGHAFNFQNSEPTSWSEKVEDDKVSSDVPSQGNFEESKF